ncbi:MAG: ABC transporter permease subunit/CPBP intramembrane protease [Acidobacteriota bacterium]
MRLSIVYTIFRKEILETLRDRRTLIMMIGLPILIYPLMIIGISKLQQSQSEAQEARVSKVAVWGELPQIIRQGLHRQKTLSFEDWTGAPGELQRDLEAGRLRPLPALEKKRDADAHESRPSAKQTGSTQIEEENPVLGAARTIISSRRVDAVLVAWPGLSRELTEGRLGKISVYFDSVREESQKARERLESQMTELRQELVGERLIQHGLPEGFASVLEVLPRNVAPESRRTGKFIGSILPFLLIIISASSGLYAAIDVTAGEKERNTMQTLLCAPLRYTEIIAGKFLTVWVVGLIGALANIASMAATFTRFVIPEAEINVAPGVYLLTFLMLFPATFTITAVFLGVAVFAKDFKDGQNFLTPVIMGLMLPLLATLTPGVELNPWTAFVPILNIALLIKALFLAEAHPEAIFLTAVSSVTYAMLTLVLAARVFEREQVLLGGKESVRSLLSFRRQKGSLPSPLAAFATFSVILVVAFYGSLWLQKSGIISMVLVTQYGFFLAPTLAVALGAGYGLVRTFSLKVPPLRGLLAAILIGLSGWAVIGGLLIRLLPPPESLTKALEKILLLDDKPVPLWAVWLVLGITPAICEELFFRGFVMSGFRRLGKTWAIFLSALLFGLAHSSIYRLLPTLFLGLLIGYVVWKTGSIFCGMVAHAVNNGLLASFVHMESLAQQFGLNSMTYVPWSWTVAGTVAVAAALALLFTLPQQREDGNARAAQEFM